MLFQSDGNMYGLEMCVDKNVKNERKCSLNKNEVLFSPMNRLQMVSGKVSFCTSYVRRFWGNVCFRASVAVETILVLPIFFLGMVTMISFMDIYKEQTEHLVELCENVKTAGMYAYVLNDSGPEEVTLPDVYSYKPVGGLISLPKVWMYNLVTVHAWTGNSYESKESETTEMEEMVYVTETGSVYHTDLGCSYLNVSVTQVSGSTVEYLKNDYGNHYGACATCCQGKNPAAVVYVTEKGSSYHNLETCSALKRTVRMVKHSCTEGMTACSRCG